VPVRHTETPRLGRAWSASSSLVLSVMTTRALASRAMAAIGAAESGSLWAGREAPVEP
jgi:hypothetical protein